MLIPLFRFKRSQPLHLLTREDAIKAHQGSNREAIIHGSTGGEYVGDFVFGGIDGVVTTFAVVAGIAGADLSAGVVLIAGLASLFADGFAMGVGNFLSIRASFEHYLREREREAWEIDHIPEAERQEIADIYAAKGFSGEGLQYAVQTITADKERWLNTMLQEELGLASETRSAMRGGLITFIAFITIGFVPLLSFVVALFVESLQDYTFGLSVALTGLALFAIGALKTLVVPRSLWRSGGEILVIGSVVAFVAYLVGYVLRDVPL